MLFKISDGSSVVTAVTLGGCQEGNYLYPDASLLNSTEYEILFTATDIYGQILMGRITFTTIAA